MKVGVGLVSYGREDYRKQAIAAIDTHLLFAIDSFVVVEDVAPVARAKNEALTTLMHAGCDWMLLSEDDVIVQSAKAVTGYIHAAEMSGIEHLNFHVHGTLNTRPVGTDETGLVTYWRQFVAPWSLFSRRSIKTVGLMDDAFVNSMEHVEHTMRLAKAGFHPLPTGIGQSRAADATGSEGWLAEIPDSRSVIDGDGRQRERIAAARRVWKAKDPDSYHRLFAL